MFGYPTVLVDQERLALFTLLGQGKGLFKGAVFWTDAQGIAWVGTRVGRHGVAFTWLGPGWVFDPIAQQDLAEQYEARLCAMRKADEKRHHRELIDLRGQLRLGGHAERVLWALHLAVRQARSSMLCLSDHWLRELVWGSQEVPCHWRSNVLHQLRSLSKLHVCPWESKDPPPFGPGTALLDRVRDVIGSDEDRCPDDCPHRGGQSHHHIQVQIGPAFLGLLHEFGHRDSESGIVTYAFPKGGEKFEGPSLGKVGKTGQLVSVFWPAKLGDPAACEKLTAEQHRLLQALVRETTRAKRKSRKEVSEAEVFVGNAIRSFDGKKIQPCSWLDLATSYVGYNGNGKRKGLGYLLASAGGWMAKAGYALDEVDRFLDDLSDLASLLGLVVVGVDRQNHFVDLDRLRSLGATPAGRRQRERLHLRIYTAADYLERWQSLFHPNGSPATSPTPVSDEMAALQSMMKRKRISQRRLASGIGADHSFLSKLLRRDKPWPEGLLQKAQHWLDQQEGPQPAGKPTPAVPEGQNPKSESTDLLAIALGFLKRGWSVVPQLPGKKMPLVKWKPYQDRRPTEEEWAEWAEVWPDAGLALILGPISGVFVIDVDGTEAHAALLERLGQEPNAVKALSGSGKPFRYHLYFRNPSSPTKAKQTPWHPKLEFRGHRGIVVIPPSLHQSGNRYVWAPSRSPNEMDLPELPAKVLDALKPVPVIKVSSPPSIRSKLSVAGIDASPRTLAFLTGSCAEGPHWNDRLFAAACDLCGRSMPIEKAEPLLLAGAQPWNQGEAEAARRTVQSAYSQPREPAKL